MKKIYITPTSTVFSVNLQKLICQSQGYTLNTQSGVTEGNASDLAASRGQSSWGDDE